MPCEMLLCISSGFGNIVDGNAFNSSLKTIRLVTNIGDDTNGSYGLLTGTAFIITETFGRC